MGIYEEFRDDLVASLMQDFGCDMTLKVKTSATYTDTTGAKTAGTSKNYTLRGISNRYVKGETADGVYTRDLELYCSASGLTVIPTTSDRLVFSGADHAITKVIPIAPGGLVIMYQIQVREP